MSPSPTGGITSDLAGVVSQPSRVAITNDLAVVIGQPSQMASSFTSGASRGVGEREIMNKSLTYGLLLSILMVIAPHADHLPLWVSSLCVGLLLWRAYLTYTGNPLPKRWLLMLITVASIGSIVISFHTLFGREVGVTLLMLLATLKLMELRAARDAMVLIYLACFIIITNFFYSQSIPTALYLLATLMVIVTAWVHLQAQRITL